MERIEIEECLERIISEITPQTRTKKVTLENCVGRVLCEDVTAGMMVPPFPKSAMDGYAVRAKDTVGANEDAPVKLRVVGELLAGDTYDAESGEAAFGEKTAVRVMTGSLIPDAYDAVVRQEDTDYGMDEVTVFSGVQPYANYCKIGEDIKKGQVVIEGGTLLRPCHVGLLASIGICEVEIYEPARIGIISTGTELCEAGMELAPGKIYNSISHMLAAEITSMGFEVSVRTICEDDEELLTEKLRQALDISDFCITTGAVSVGKKDIVPAVLEKMGAKKLFSGANIQPGTPTMASVLNDKVILSLSGNPYAAIANFELYFWNIMSVFMHNSFFDTKIVYAVLKSEYNKVNKMRRLIRAYAKDGEVTLPSSIHASSVIHNLTECNCFIDLEPDRKVKVGDRVRVIMFRN